MILAPCSRSQINFKVCNHTHITPSLVTNCCTCPWRPLVKCEQFSNVIFSVCELPFEPIRVREEVKNHLFSCVADPWIQFYHPSICVGRWEKSVDTITLLLEEIIWHVMPKWRLRIAKLKPNMTWWYLVMHSIKLSVLFRVPAGSRHACHWQT